MPNIIIPRNYNFQKPPYPAVLDRDHPLARGLVTLFIFNEGGGNRANDLSGHNNTGILTNMAVPPTTNSGFYGGTLNFDRTNDYVVADSVATKKVFSGNHTIVAWGRLDSWASNQTIFGATENVTARGYDELDFSNADKRFYARTYYYSPSATNDVGSLLSYNNDKNWHCLVSVVNTQGKIVGFYVDGVFQGSGANAVNLATMDSFWVGQLKWSSANVNCWGGAINYVAIYNRALTIAEIQQLYSEPYCMIKERNAVLQFGPDIHDETNKLQLIKVEQSKTETFTDVNTYKIVVKRANYTTQKPPYPSVLDRSHPLARGLAGLWLFNENGGDKVNDISGNSKTGVLTNFAHPSTSLSGWQGGVLNFDTDDYVDISLANKLNSSTYSIWFKCSIDTGLYWFFTAPASSTNSLHVAGGVACFYLWDGSPRTLTSTITINDGKWHNVTVVQDTENTYMYVDGKYNVQMAYLTTQILTSFHIGRSSLGGNLSGSVSNASIYNRALSAEEVRQLYSEPYCMIKKQDIVFFISPITAVDYDETNKLQEISVFQDMTNVITANELDKQVAIMVTQSELDALSVSETNKEQVIVVTQNQSNFLTANEINKTQVIAVNQSQSDSLIAGEISKEQAILVVQSKTDIITANELNKLQAITIEQLEADILGANELNKLQEIMVEQAQTDMLTANEINKAQVIVAELAETDIFNANEIGKAQAILVSQTEADNIIANETNKVQIILVIQTETDEVISVIIYDETGKEQRIVATQTETDVLIGNELNKLQTIIIAQLGIDILVANEISKLQEVLIIQSGYHHFIAGETNKEQVILATQSATDVLTGNELDTLCRILVVTDESDTQNMVETSGVITIICTQSEVDYLINGDLARKFAGKKPYKISTGTKPLKDTSGKKPYFKFTL